MLFSDHNRNPLRQQPAAMTIGHDPKGVEKILNLRWVHAYLSQQKHVCLQLSYAAKLLLG